RPRASAFAHPSPQSGASPAGASPRVPRGHSRASLLSPVPIPRLKAEETAILVIDVQERLMPTIVDRNKLCHNCAVLLRMANELAIPSLVTEQYVQGLGRTVDSVTAAMANPAARLEKTRFSAAVDMVVDQFRRWRRTTVIVAGIEAHVCVLQSVL